jgi:hypothetical protein
MSSLSSSKNLLWTSEQIKFLSSDSDESEGKAVDTIFFYNSLLKTSKGFSSPSYLGSSTTAANTSQPMAKLLAEAKKKADYLFALSCKDEFVAGEVSAAEIYLESIYNESPALFSETFQKCWLKLYSFDKSNVLADFICNISSINYDWLKDKADALVIAGCAHRDPYVNEATLRAIEAWEKPSHISYLRNVRKFELEWLEDYKKDVITYIEGCDELLTA